MKQLIFLFIIHCSLALAAPTESSLSYQGNSFSYFSNQVLSDSNPLIEEAIIVVHGSDRNADTYFHTVSLLAEQAGMKDSTIVIAPHFKLATDVLNQDELNWSDEGWLKGDPSLNNPIVNSFDIVDQLIDILNANDKFPNLKSIIITGHSAGGQLTQRYALGSTKNQEYPKIHFKYLVLNPGSYVYLNTNRPVLVPEGNTCAYNDYKYGLDHLNIYMTKAAKSLMIQNYIQKDVVYFLGEKDTDTTELDQECPAQFQGINRLERGRNFKSNIDVAYPENKHALITNPDIAHTEWGMYSSALGRKLLFSR